MDNMDSKSEETVSHETSENGFQVKEINGSANGGTVNTNRKSELMSYTEYSRKNGSDGFSKTGGR